MESSITPKDIFRMIRRRAGLIVTMVVVLSGLALLLAYLIPPTYVASAKILIESQRIPTELAPTTVRVSAAERLELIKQRLMTRSNLLSIIERLDLYDERPDLSKSERVELIRESTSLHKITVEDNTNNRRRGNADISAFTISFKDSDAKRAAQITNEFVTIVLEQNLKSRSERAAQTHDWFKEEVAQLDEQLVKVEHEMAEFKIRNELSLPATADHRRTELTALRKQRFELAAQLLSITEKRNDLQNSLDTGRYVENIEQSLSPEERDLIALRRELSQLTAIYAPSHPRIRSVNTRIAALEASLQSTNSDESRVDPAERMRERIERAMRNFDNEIEMIEAQQQRDATRVEQLVAALERTPEVGMQLNALERRYNDLRLRYEDALKRKSFAATGEKLEVNRQAERFEVVEQAQVPESPTSPNRPAIAIGGFAGSIGLSVSFVVLLGLLNSSIRTIGDMERRLEMRPLMTVPYITTDRERRRARRELLMLATLVLVIIPVTLYAIDQYYLPLGLLFDEFVERTELRAVLGRISDIINR